MTSIQEEIPADIKGRAEGVLFAILTDALASDEDDEALHQP